MDTKDRVRDFLASRIKDHELRDDDDFFARGFVDSMFAMQLVLFLEKEFAISIDGSEMRIDNFKTVNAITDIVSRKTAASAA